MGIDAFKSEIDRFLASSDAEVLVISGKWGVGKTFAWNKFLREARDRNNGIALERYAYVSLFGLGDLGEVRQAVFENTVGRAKAGDAADLTSLESGIKTATGGWRKAAGFLRAAGPLADYAAAIDKIGFFSVRKQVVCIDDLERKSGSLEMRDILGLVSFLKEQRACKVVVLLNDEQLGADDEEFRIQLEKVADTTIRYQPTPAEAVEIGVDRSKSHHEVIVQACSAFGIVNIRTIKRLERLSVRLCEILAGYDVRVVRQAVHTASLFGCSKVQPDQAPTIEFLKTYSPYEGLLAHDNQPLSHPEWREMLRQYDFGSLDEFDAVLLEGVEAGHFDPAKLKAAADIASRRLQHVDNEHAFSAAWELYRNSFGDNQAEVTGALVAALRAAPSVVTPTNLSGTITLLKELNWEGNIGQLISEYIDGRDDGREFWDLNESAFGGEVRDPDVRDAFVAKLATFEDDRDPEEVLKRIGEERGWGQDDVRFLSLQSPATFRGIFKRLSGTDFHRAIRGGLMFRNIQNADTEMQLVTANVEAALREIGQESPINLRRVRQKGVQIEDPSPPPPIADSDEQES